MDGEPLLQSRSPAASAAAMSLTADVGSSGSLLKQASTLLVVYLSVGVLVYSLSPQSFSGAETHPAVDALYFSIVTLCTIGYGDIAPLTPAAKAFACGFVLVGFGLADAFLSAALAYAHDGLLLSSSAIVFDAEKGRVRIRLKVALAVGAVVLCVGAGAVALRVAEGMEWVDAVYLSVMSVTTVGYGDRAFRTVSGRAFASGWLLVSTLAVARAFLYLAEARIDRRRRRFARRVLSRNITVEDLIAANINHNGFISKSEFVVYKLKEMGKIGQNDILEICNQFNKLDPNNTGKITLSDLLNNST